MTSLSSAAKAGTPPGSTRATTSRSIGVRRMERLLSSARSGLEDGDPVSPHERTQQEDGADDDDEDDGAERAGDAGVAVLDLGENRHRAEVEAGIDQEDHGAHRDHAIDEEVDEDRKGRAREQGEHDAPERADAARAEAHRGLLDGRVDLLERIEAGEHRHGELPEDDAGHEDPDR